MYKTVLTDFPELKAIFTDRNNGVSQFPFNSFNCGLATHDNKQDVLLNRKRLFSQLDLNEDKIAWINQVHGNHILKVDDGGLHGPADGMITDREDLTLCISVADCAAILIYDPIHKVIAALHSGWRGTAGNIVSKCIQILTTDYQSNPESLHLYISPCLSQDHFEVGDDLKSIFPEKYFKLKTRDKFLFDMRQVIIDQVASMGVHHIDNDYQCTFSKIDTYYSYRRDKENSGRMLALIQMKKK